MKLFLKNIFLFTVIILLVYPLLIAISGSFIPKNFKPNISYKLGAYGHLYSRTQEIRKSVKNIDVLILGSSHAYRGFDPRNFKNKKVFNLGSSSQSPINTNVLLKRYLDKLKPKIVIYEVFPNTFSSDGVESSLDIVSNDKNDVQSVRMAFQINNIKTYNTFIYSFIRDLLHLNESYSEPVKKGKDRYIPGGFVESEMKYYKVNRQEKHEWSFNKSQIKAFNENIELLKQRNIKTILVFAPITTSMYNSYTNNYYPDSLMKSYQLDYYNFNNLIQLSDSIDFYDDNHLNQNGVNKFNQKLDILLFHQNEIDTFTYHR
jgi:hypothetical protein